MGDRIQKQMGWSLTLNRATAEKMLNPEMLNNTQVYDRNISDYLDSGVPTLITEKEKWKLQSLSVAYSLIRFIAVDEYNEYNDEFVLLITPLDMYSDWRRYDDALDYEEAVGTALKRVELHYSPFPYGGTMNPETGESLSGNESELRAIADPSSVVPSIPSEVYAVAEYVKLFTDEAKDMNFHLQLRPSIITWWA